MTTTDCYITLVGLKSHINRANPKPFRQRLPFSGPGQYWACTVERFAKARGIKIRWVIDNCTPEIIVTGPQLRELLVEAYGMDADFVRIASPYLAPGSVYEVYADDF
jgi:hypothetical protein